MISGVTGPGSAELGSEVTLTAQVMNRGECKAPPFHLSFRLSADDAGEHSIPLPGVSCEIPDGLSVSESASCDAQWAIPITSVVDSNFWLMAIDDSGFDATESDETNNVGVGGSPITIASPSACSFEGLAANASATCSGDATVPDGLADGQSYYIGAFRLGLYFSSDQAITTGDVKSTGFCGYENGLAAGATTTCNGEISVPQSLNPGAGYFLGAYVDDDRQVAESDEGNNSASAGRIDMEGNTGTAAICVHNDGSYTSFIQVYIGDDKHDAEIDFNEHACFSAYSAGQYTVGAMVYWYGGYGYVWKTITRDGGTANVHLAY